MTIELLWYVFWRTALAVWSLLWAFYALHSSIKTFKQGYPLLSVVFIVLFWMQLWLMMQFALNVGGG